MGLFKFHEDISTIIYFESTGCVLSQNFSSPESSKIIVKNALAYLTRFLIVYQHKIQKQKTMQYLYTCIDQKFNNIPKIESDEETDHSELWNQISSTLTKKEQIAIDRIFGAFPPTTSTEQEYLENQLRKINQKHPGLNMKRDSKPKHGRYKFLYKEKKGTPLNILKMPISLNSILLPLSVSIVCKHAQVHSKEFENNYLEGLKIILDSAENLKSNNKNATALLKSTFIKVGLL